MYKYLIPALVLLPAIATAQDKDAPKGKKTKCTVVDAVTKKTVKEVTALVQGSEEKIVAPNDLFQAVLAPGMQVEISAPGYEDRQLVVAPDGKCYTELAPGEEADDKDDNDSEE